MSTYRKADKEILALVADLVRQFHPALLEAGVRVGCLMAFAPRNESTGEPRGPALKWAGYPAAALVKVTSHKDRVAGLPDALICVDGDRWPEWGDARKRALLDHELEHLEVIRDEEGAVKLDDCNRPRLKNRPHDWEIGGFESIAKRHKEAAFEVEQTRSLAHKYGQLLFPF